MKHSNKRINNIAELRKRAEKFLGGQPEELSGMTLQDFQVLVHELHVHEVELSMQNQELHETQRRLEEIRDRYMDLFDFAPVGYFVLGKGDVILEANLKGAGMLGVERAALTGKRFTDFVGKVSQDAFHLHRAAVLEGRPVKDAEVVLLEKGGGKFAARLESVSMKAGEGPAQLRVAVMDVTEQKAAEERKRRMDEDLQHVQKLESLGVLAGGVAHDLNNLMLAIMANSELALGYITPDSPAYELVEQVEKSSERAAGLARKLLSYSGRDEMRKTAVDLNALVNETVQTLRPSVSRATAAAVTLQLEDRLPAVEADPVLVQQVVMNLILNASDAMAGGEGGKIMVFTGSMRADRAYLDGITYGRGLPEGYYSYIEVADNGQGMGGETRKKIFEPYYTTKSAGRGLGLSAVLGIVRGHGGAIEVESEPGRGSRFRVLLPVNDKGLKAVPEVRPAPLKEGQAKGTVLFVDDEESVLTAAGKALKRAGYEVLTARCGKDAVEVFRANAGRISVVVMDLIMPEMSGEEASLRIREIREDTRIILTSGYHNLNLDRLIGGKAVTAMLKKPYRLSALLTKLDDVMQAAN